MEGKHSIHSNKSTATRVMLILAAFIVIVAGLRAASGILVPFLLAIFIATISAAPLFWLRKHGVPRWLSILIIIISIFIIGFLMAWLLGASVKGFTTDLPKYQKEYNQLISFFVENLSHIGIDAKELQLTKVFNPASAMGYVASGLNNLRKVLTNSVMISLTVIFMLLEASSIPDKIRYIVGDDSDAMEPFEEFVETLKNYIAIKSIFSLLTGILVTVMTFVMDLDYPFLWGLVAFALNFVPNIGSIIAAIPPVMLAVIQLGTIKAALIAGGYLVINMLIGSGLEPRFMGKGLGLSTLVVFLSLVFWGWILGPIGMLLSVPLTITVKIALDIREETRWLSILLGPEDPHKQQIGT